MIDARAEEVSMLLDRGRRALRHQLDRADSELTHTHARVVALSPAATLKRGTPCSSGRTGTRCARRTRWRRARCSGRGCPRASSRYGSIHRVGGMTGKTEQTAVAEALGYEQARDELIEVVRRLEAGGTSLEESLALWERGEELAKVCRRWLDGARARLDAALAEEEQGRRTTARSRLLNIELHRGTLGAVNRTAVR